MLVTFVHDLKPYYTFIAAVTKDIEVSETILSSEIEFLKKYNYTGVYATYNSLSLEIDMIKDTLSTITESFDQFNTLNNPRNKRSLLPIIGQARSALFGTLLEDDLDGINHNIKILSQNQKEIVYDLSLSLSVLKMSRIEIAKNRRDIKDVVKCIQKFDDEILD